MQRTFITSEKTGKCVIQKELDSLDSMLERSCAAYNTSQDFLLNLYVFLNITIMTYKIDKKEDLPFQLDK